MRSLTTAALVLGLAPLAVAAGPQETAADAEAKTYPKTSLQDAEIEAWRTDLLELAFAAASKHPLVPHVKDRARAQESVSTTCFELDLPRRALGYIEEIPNWRIGTGYADYAMYCAESGGDREEVEFYLGKAREVANWDPEKLRQAWRRDRILAKVAGLELWLGRQGEAAAIEAARPEVSEDVFAEHIQALEAAARTGGLDETRSILVASVQLYDQVFQNPDRRKLIEAKIKESWSGAPPQIRIETLLAMAQHAVDHEDGPRAVALVNEALSVLESVRWTANFEIPLRARISGMRYAGGAKEEARAELAELVEGIDESFQWVTPMDRSDTLRPLAEALARAEDPAGAHAVYARAVEEGAKNPNGRPRADDLTAVCCSMAKSGVKPDADLWARLNEIFEGLKPQPW